jgi:predicted nicotinamide N-methyase
MASRRDFILANTKLIAVPLVPEISLHLAHEAVPLWQKTEEELGEIGLPPPFWAFAWAGGQALARYVLDEAHIVAGKSVLDMASGSGLVGIAAMKAGAASVIAAEIDGFAVEAVSMNAASNGVTISTSAENLLNVRPPVVNAILVGDLFYEKSLAERLLLWLQEAVNNGSDVLIGDPGRSYLPKQKLVSQATYEVPVTRDLEDAEIKKTQVWKLA